LGMDSTVDAPLATSPDHDPALYAPYTWELSTPHRCLICDVETPALPVKFWNVPHKREWVCYRHLALLPRIAVLIRSKSMVDVVLEFQAQYVFQKKRCACCHTEKHLAFFWPSGRSVVGASNRLIVSEGETLVALCPLHMKLKSDYCDE
jgi:hypothetical protein